MRPRSRRRRSPACSSRARRHAAAGGRGAEAARPRWRRCKSEQTRRAGPAGRRAGAASPAAEAQEIDDDDAVLALAAPFHVGPKEMKAAATDPLAALSVQVARALLPDAKEVERARLIAMAFAASRGQMDDFWAARKMRGGRRRRRRRQEEVVIFFFDPRSFWTRVRGAQAACDCELAKTASSIGRRPLPSLSADAIVARQASADRRSCGRAEAFRERKMAVIHKHHENEHARFCSIAFESRPARSASPCSPATSATHRSSSSPISPRSRSARASMKGWATARCSTTARSCFVSPRTPPAPAPPSPAPAAASR